MKSVHAFKSCIKVMSDGIARVKLMLSEGASARERYTRIPMLPCIGVTFEGVNGFNSNMACFEAPFKGFPSNLNLFKNSVGNMFIWALKYHKKANFTNFEGL